MGLVSLLQYLSWKGLMVGLAVTLLILVSICPDLQAGCLARGYQACQGSTCVFLTPIRGFAVVIIYTWLFWTLPTHLLHAYSLRLFRPPRSLPLSLV